MQVTFRNRSQNWKSLVCLSAALVFASSAHSQQRAIAPDKSELSVHVYKAGILSAFGHDHDIAAPVTGGSVDLGAHRVELRVHAGALRVRDREVSEKDRAEIQKTMLGPEVLDAARHQEIIFRSTSAERGAEGVWRVQGTLTLHGETRPVTLTVRETDGRYTGSVRLKQTDFGIKPVKVAGGTVRVKDEIRVDFNIQLDQKEGRSQ